MEKIDISVCVVAYNHRNYICKAIDSIFAQKTDYRYEVIVNDDCSTDGTAEVIRQTYGDKVQLIARKKNVGLTRSIYDMYLKAKGEYIVDLAGDDWFCSTDVLQKHVDFLKNNPEYSSVSNWIIQVDKNENVMWKIKFRATEYSLKEMLCWDAEGCCVGTMRNYFHDREEDDSFIYKCNRNNEEIPMCVFLLERGKHGIIPEFMVSYRYVNEEGQSNYNSTHKAVDIFEDYYTTIDNMKKYHGQHYYEGMEIKMIHSRVYSILRTFNVKQIKRFLTIIGWKKAVRTVCLAPFIWMNHGSLPKFIEKKCK